MELTGFIDGAYQAQSTNVDCEICMNLFVENVSGSGRVGKWLASCPGLVTQTRLSFDPTKAAFSEDGRTFFVSGGGFFEYFPDSATFTLRGTMATDDNPATITSNGDDGGQLFITSGDHGYVYDLGADSLNEVLSSGATMCDFLGGYVLVLDAATATVVFSELFDCSSFPGINFFQRSQGSDKWIGMKVVNADVWLMGSQTSEAWYLSGNAFPFAARPGVFIQQGTASGFCLAELNSTLVWVSHNQQGGGEVMRLNGYAPQKISTFAIDYQIQSYGVISDAIGFTYHQDGHSFYLVSFPSAGEHGVTWGYDDTTQKWHQRGFFNQTTGQYETYAISCHCHTDNNQHLAGARVNGHIYLMDPTVSTDVDGTGIRRQRRFVLPSAEQKYQFISNLQIHAESGVGLAFGQGDDPQLMISWSKDAGHSFTGNQWVPLGKQGEYDRRSMIRGTVMRARNPVIDVAVSDPVPVRLLNAFADIEVGAF